MITFKALAALLSYPDEALVSGVPEVRQAIKGGGLLSSRERTAIEGLLAQLASEDLISLQENYIRLFDRTRSLSLHLFEHVHGESRDRGQAMVDLRNLYATHGLAISANELPDYLPVFLEFLSQRPAGEARAMLVDIAHILREIGNRLAGRGSGYAAVFDALLALAGEKGLDAAKAQPVQQPKEDLAALDREWEDAQVTFGPGPAEPQRAVVHVHRRVT